MKKNIIILSIALICSLSACNKLDDFLNKVPASNQSLVYTINDCDLLLNNRKLIGGYDHVYFLDDCIGFTDIESIFSEGTPRYNEFTYWTKTKYIIQASEIDPLWNSLYSSIFYTNVVIDNIDKVTGDNNTFRSNCKGEAYLGRAFYHFIAVNSYAKEYNATTASTDLGIPYVKDINTLDKRKRNTVQEVYDNILNDLSEAEKNLENKIPEDGKKYRGSLIGAYGIMTKVYLHMQNWEKVIEYANKTLSISNTLIDYNKYSSYAQYKASNDYKSFYNTENLYVKGNITENYSIPPAQIIQNTITYRTIYGGLYLTKEISDIIDINNDLRYKLFMGKDEATGNMTLVNIKGYDNNYRGCASVGVNIGEIYLILAEAYARTNKLSEACSTLNTLLKTRYNNKTFTNFSSTDKNTIIEKIINEKKIDMIYTGNRWFEMRRLNTLGEYNKTINRTNVKGEIIGTLTTSPARMVFPIPQQIININSNIEPNPFE